jgi:UDP-N-acetyl-D-mannosaminuronic acid dehydrogenase
MSTICVVGLGYIGLPVASMLASRNHQVIGFDINERAVASINNGHAHFFEPDLDMLLKAAVYTGRLQAQTTPIEADYFIIAVPTPFGEQHRPDMSYVDAATQAIAPFLKVGTTVILESTSPVGTTERMTAQLAQLRPDLRFPAYKDAIGEADVAIAHCPERIMPGQMVRELVTNDRIIGGMTENCSKSASKLYESFVSSQMFVTDCRTAEFVKLIENSYRDVNIAFANELSLICDRLGVDVWAAIELANRHPRVSILQPGSGVGGHCIAVDPWFIINSAPEESRLISAARDVNDNKPHWLARRIRQHADRFKNPVVGCFGIAYKADVEDVRESPSLEVVKLLASESDIRVLICDPMVKEPPSELRSLNKISFNSIDETCLKADIVAFLVGHRQFRRMDPNHFLNKVVVDAIGLLSKPRM